MTNNPTIDGVSRLIKLAAELASRRPLRPLQDLCERQKSVRTSSLLESVEMCGDTLAAIALDIRKAADLLTSAAPVVERQPAAHRIMHNDGYTDGWFSGAPSKHDLDDIAEGALSGVELAYTAPPEVAALQSTIAQLREGIAKHWQVVCDQRAEIAQLQARVAELESGRDHV